MATKFPRVLPGDLITASFMNLILDELEALDAKITGPAGDHKAVILEFQPQKVKVGDELRIVGRGFGIPSLDIVAFQDLYRVDKFKAGSNDGLLILDVPAILGLPAGGGLVPITLSTPNGFVRREDLVVQPRDDMPLSGLLTVTLSPSTPSQAIQVGDNEIVYRLQAQTTTAATYKVTAKASTGWATSVLDEADNPVTTLEIPKSLSPGTTRELTVKMTVPAGTASGTTATVNFKIVALESPAFNGGAAVPITVGQPVNVQDAIVITLTSAFNPGKKDGADVKVKKPAATTDFAVKFNAVLKKPGHYTIATPTVQNKPGLWKPVLKNSATNITTATENEPVTITVQLTADAALKTDGTDDDVLTVTVSSDDTSDVGTLQTNVNVTT